MASLRIPATKSLTICDKIPSKDINDEFILVGNEYKNLYTSYLFFNTSNIPDNILLLSAELVLFKSNHFFENENRKFYIHPLKKYFSDYTTYKNQPELERTLKVEFKPNTKDVSVEIDITKILKHWIKNPNSNKGISISVEDYKDSTVNAFCSSLNKDCYSRPFIILSYKQLIGGSVLTKLEHCKPHIKYEIIAPEPK